MLHNGTCSIVALQILPHQHEPERMRQGQGFWSSYKHRRIHAHNGRNMATLIISEFMRELVSLEKCRVTHLQCFQVTPGYF